MSARIGILQNGILKTSYLFGSTDSKKLSLLLRDNYKKDSEINNLIIEGDISNLTENIETSRFFHRDCNEPWEACQYYSEEINELSDISNFSPVDYYFIWTNKWNVYEVYAEEPKWLSVTKYLTKLKKR